MENIMKSIRRFASEDDGAQIVEYSLIIAVVSILLIVALRALTDDGGSFDTFIGKVGTCLTTPASCTA